MGQLMRQALALPPEGARTVSGHIGTCMTEEDPLWQFFILTLYTFLA